MAPGAPIDRRSQVRFWRSARQAPNLSTRGRGAGAARGPGAVVGNGQPKDSLMLVETSGLALGPDGSVFVGDAVAHRVYRVGPDGRGRKAAGTGSSGYSGDGASALLAELDSPHGLAVDQFGTVFGADTRNHVIRRIGADGNIDTIVGTGVAGHSGNGFAALEATLSSPAGVAVGADGLIFVADIGNDVVRSIDPAGDSADESRQLQGELRQSVQERIRKTVD
ncbi:MAG: hypothetical protein HYV07_08405 [Deltaproteobacteria bacterium]|nr:hypothetical protein [Deltaproteobacteria bacterium]